MEPLFTGTHKTEGFALDWSPIQQGYLASGISHPDGENEVGSGDCQSGLTVWQPRDNTDWQPCALEAGHVDSVEDIQWSPTEATVLATASVDKTIKIWDIREP